MSINLTPELRARMVAALSSADRENLKSLIDLLCCPEDTSGYDDDLLRADTESRAHDGLSIREKEVIAHFRKLSDDTRLLFIEAIDATAPAAGRKFTESEILTASNQDSLHSVERLALHIVGYLALRAWFGSVMLSHGGLDNLYTDIANALRGGLQCVDFGELQRLSDE